MKILLTLVAVIIVRATVNKTVILTVSSIGFLFWLYWISKKK